MSTFNWNTGKPSIFYTEAGERAAKAQAIPGQAMDTKGRALVQMEPRGPSQGAISITTEAQSLRTQRIKRGTSI